MTDTAGPFDGTPWAEAQWYRHAAMWGSSGCYGTPSTSTTTGDLPLSVSALSVGLGAGRASVRGAGFERSGAAVMQSVAANTHASFYRRDRIVLRRDLAAHTVTAVLLTGTPASSPAAPALTQSDTGSWDLPLFSFLVPPASGTTLSGIVDERGWVNGAGVLNVPSTAVRDAHFPAPVQGNSCTVLGEPHTHDGTAWRFLWAISSTGVTDAAGFIAVVHNFGQVPRAVVVTVRDAGDTVNQRLKWLVQTTDTSSIVIRAVRTDTSAYWATAALAYDLIARF